MLIKMKESKGFTLVELMIVVAIIGILAAVAVPYYQRYVAKSKLTSLVMPAIHSIETNISTAYAVQSGLPTIDSPDSLGNFTADSDLSFVTVTYTGWNTSATAPYLTITVRTTAVDSNNKQPFSSIKEDRNTFNIVATPVGGQKLYWSYSGPLAQELGL